MSPKNPVMLIIFDGLGIDEDGQIEGDAVKQARTPVLDELLKSNPWSYLQASHHYVGLPDGQMGNSEVGHLNMGAGRVVYQDLMKVSKALADGSLLTNENIQQLAFHGKKLHFLGLLSDGGVHSSIEHLIGFIRLIKKINPARVIRLHSFLDGRDTPPKSALVYLNQLAEAIADYPDVEITSLCGRYYAMDRDNNWDRTRKAVDLLCEAKGEFFSDFEAAIRENYLQSVTDEFLEPVWLGGEQDVIDSGDAVFFYNFRADRARQITRALTGVMWDGAFPVKPLSELHYVCLSSYHEKFGLPVLFEKDELRHMWGELISNQGINQLRIAETEKYAHVTFFFNGGSDIPYKGEDRILVNSPKVATYDMLPQMSAPEVTQKLIEAIDQDKYGFIVLNFANPDMVGHTGSLPAAITALESVDECLGIILQKMAEKNGTTFLTADHGNCEKMYADLKSKEPHTAHTTNRVFFAATGHRTTGLEIGDGKLADIAPSVLNFMGISVPSEMTGNNLFLNLPTANKVN